MTRKHGDGAARDKRRNDVDGGEIFTAIREGRLTRGQFDAWRATRRREGLGFVITMREKGPEAAAAKRPARRHRAR